jgi:predicted PurR-regulated permease PerM
MSLSRGVPTFQARVVLQVILVMLAVAAAIWALYRLERVVFLLILTTFFAYLVAPIVRLAERPMRIAGTERRMPRGLAIGIIYLCILAVVCTGAGILLPRVTQQINDAISQAPVYGGPVTTTGPMCPSKFDRASTDRSSRRARGLSNTLADR